MIQWAFPGLPPNIPAKAFIFMMVTIDCSISGWGASNPILTRMMMRPGLMQTSSPCCIVALHFLMKLVEMLLVLSLLVVLRYSSTEVDSYSLWKMMVRSFEALFRLTSYLRIKAVSEGVNHSPAPFLYIFTPQLTNFWMLYLPLSTMKSSIIRTSDASSPYFSTPSALRRTSASIICPTLSMHPHPTSEVSAECSKLRFSRQVNQRVEQYINLAVQLSQQ